MRVQQGYKEFVLASVTKLILNIQQSKFVITKSADEMLRTFVYE